jgi:hypothetical protein
MKSTERRNITMQEAKEILMDLHSSIIIKQDKIETGNWEIENQDYSGIRNKLSIYISIPEDKIIKAEELDRVLKVYTNAFCVTIWKAKPIVHIDVDN